MRNPTKMEMAASGQSFLNAQPIGVRREGENCFQNGAVNGIVGTANGTHYHVTVEGGNPLPFTVNLSFECAPGQSVARWNSECSCPWTTGCTHIYAAMRAVIAHMLTRPRQLSLLEPGKSTPALAPDPKPLPRPRKTLTSELKAALRRPLNPEESQYVSTIERAHQESRFRDSIGIFHAAALGFEVEETDSGRLEIAPGPAGDIFDFWNRLAYTATRVWGQAIPEFIECITNLEIQDERIRKWCRDQTIEHWIAIITEPDDERVSNLDGNESEVRLRLVPGRARLEIRESFKTSFAEIKPNQIFHLRQRIDADNLNLAASSTFLWGTLEPQFQYGSDSSSLSYDNPKFQRLLFRVLDTPALRDRVVTETETPYAFSSERLQWTLQDAAGPDDDYTLLLVRTDGSTPPPALVALKGRTLAWVSADTVYFGPRIPSTLNVTPAVIKIPAPALESAAGVDFLGSLGLELPTRLRERVRRVPFNLCIQCEAAPIYPGSATEDCRIRLLARSADGLVEEQWNGSNWTEDFSSTEDFSWTDLHAKDPDPDPSEADSIVCYDRSALAGAPQLLSRLDLRWDGWQGFARLRITKKFPEEFATFCKSLPPDVTLELHGELDSLGRDAIAGTVSLNVAEAGIDWFDLSVILDTSETDLTPAEIKLLLDARGGFVRLRGKGWRRLQFNLSPEEDERLACLGLNPRELTSEPQRLHVLQLADPAARKFLPEEQFDRVQRRASELQARVTPDIPNGIAAELRPYQREGFHFLSYLTANRFGGILADDMGLGKTLQTLTWLKWLWSQKGNAGRTVLVVCPKSVMDNWRSETARFTADIRPRMWSAGELGQLPKETASADLHIINYSQLRSLGESLAPLRWLAVILDEGQYIKNPSSQTAQVARSLVADHRLVLTGTPIENRLLDLWSLMTFAMPGVLGSRTMFNRQFSGKDDPHARRRLSARVRPFLVRRTKSQVAKDLPDKIEEDLFCEMEGEQRTLYRAELKRAQQMLLKVQTSKQLNQERFNVLTSLLRLRQICCDPRLVKADSRASSAKVDALMEQLEPLMEEGQKVLIFSQFVSMLDLLHEPLAEKGWPLFYLAGDTENRGELVERFQKAEGNAVFLISLKAGGFGLNLTSAGYVILFDPWWNPAVENQAIDRTHRIGQTQKVIAYRLLIKDSIEEKIRTLQKQKRSLAEDVLGEEKFAQTLTLDDLHFLLA
ncbi:MAG TPA: DEAD/DEAH box helicase [Verrucomicrobiae bacterium]|nr:DEAD/DEAH box helicase [Verrucomicrobiae bacterium]